MGKTGNCIGLCRKAGRCVLGDFAAEKTVRAGKAKLVLLDETASANTKDKYRYLCKGREVPLLLVKSPGEAAGQPGKMVLAVTDEGFAHMIAEAYQIEKQR